MFHVRLQHASSFRRASPLAVVAILIGTMVAVVPAAGAKEPQVEELINFSTGDPATDPGTEGVAVDADGTVYVTANTAEGGQIWVVEPGAEDPEVLVTLIPPTGGAGFGVLGLHFDGPDLLAAAHTLADPDLNGVWRVDTGTGQAEHIPGTEAITLPNDITTWAGRIYITDSAAGAVWVIDGDDVSPFLQDPLLTGLGLLVPGVPIGANGIDAHGGRLFIANLEKGLVVVAQINGRSHRSQPTVYATVDGAPDGLEVDNKGRPNVVLIDQNALVRVERDGTSTFLIDSADVLDSPASLAFGRGRDKTTTYIVNFSISEAFPGVLEPSTVGPSVVTLGSH